MGYLSVEVFSSELKSERPTCVVKYNEGEMSGFQM